MSKTQTIKVFEQLFKAINRDKILEFEIKYRDRFSSYESKEFISGIDSPIYYKLLETLKNRCGNIIDTPCPHLYLPVNNGEPITYTSQTLFDGHDLYDNFRLSLYSSDATPEIIRKIRQKIPGFNSSVFPEGFKISLCKEELIDVESQEYSDFLDYIAQTNANMLIRKKKRHSFIIHLVDDNNNNIPIFRIDLTEVHSRLSQKQNSFEITFEIELEYLGNRYWEFMDIFENTHDKLSQVKQDNLIRQLERCSFDIASVFTDILKYLLENIQQSDILLNVEKHNAIYLEYLKLVRLYDGREIYTAKNSKRRDVFVGCQPETLHRRFITSLIEKEYIVFDKSDGERMLLFINDNSIFLIDRFMHINKTKASLTIPDLNNSLLDGEWIINEQGERTYIIFDALFLQKRDVRENSTIERLKYVNHIVKSLSNNKSEFNAESNGILTNADFKIITKPFVLWKKNDTGNIEHLFDRPYSTDGLTFVPNTECPKKTKWSALLKMKPIELNTIDLFVDEGEAAESNGPDSYVYDLYIKSNLIVFERKIYLLLKHDGQFEWLIDEKGNVIEVNKNNLKINQNDELRKVHNKTVKIKFPFQTSITLNKQLKNHCVYEFNFNYETRKLEPLHLRYDKSTQGFRGSNHLTVACDIWDSMFYPVTKEMIINIGNKQFENMDDYSQKLRSKDMSSMLCKKFSLNRVIRNALPHQGNDNEDKNSPLWRIKKFHGYVKREMIRHYCKNINRPTPEQILQSLGGNLILKTKDSYELRNTETNINFLNSLLGITRKQLKFSPDKSKIVITKHVYEHLTHTWLRNTKAVLDIGIGKGGDLWKYTSKELKIDYIVGIENESFLLSGADDCALTRLKQIKETKKSKNEPMDTTVCFLHMDGRSNIYDKLKEKNVEMDFDIVNCFFAIHYFFRDQESLTAMLENVSEMLTYNGFFIGTMLDGKTLNDNLTLNDGEFTNRHNDEEQNVLYRINRKYSKDRSLKSMNTCGNHIDVYLKDSIIHDYDHLQPYTKKEYLVVLDKFVEMAKHFDLELVESSMFEDFYPKYLKDNKFPGVKLTEEEKRFSFVNRTFVFRKVANSKYHRTKIIAKIDDKNYYRYNHSFDMNTHIQGRLTKIQNMQLAAKVVQDDLDKELIDNDRKIANGITPVKSMDPELFRKTLNNSNQTQQEQSTQKQSTQKQSIQNKTKLLPTKTVKPKSQKRKTTTKSPSNTKSLKKTKVKKEGCGHRGKGCTQCKRCKCKMAKVKCIEGICACSSTCTNR